MVKVEDEAKKGMNRLSGELIRSLNCDLLGVGVASFSTLSLLCSFLTKCLCNFDLELSIVDAGP